MGFFSKRNFRLLFFAVVRFSPPSPKAEAVKRKAEAKNNSPDLQEPTFNLLVAAKGEARGRAGVLGALRGELKTVFIGVNQCLIKL
jgi:hypothetical protein